MFRKLWWATSIPLILFSLAAGAMEQTSIPSKFAIPWANSAGGNYSRAIPQSSQIGLQNCAASLTDGFPPLTFVPTAAGGCPPFGQDMNGILKQITQWSQWSGAGGVPKWDSSFSASIGGYPASAIVANASTAGCYWVSSVDDNASNPDAAGAGWSASCPGGGVGGTSTSSANAQVVAGTPAVLQAGVTVQFVAGFTNTGGLKVNYNGTGLVDVYRSTQLGSSITVGGEVVAGQLIRLVYDGTRWQCTSCGAILVGEMKDWMGSTAPTGYVFADGTNYSAVGTYADLCSVIGNTYGGSAGTCSVPDLRGRMVAGRDDMGGVAANRITVTGGNFNGTTLGAAGGAQNHTLLTAEMPTHLHAQTAQQPTFTESVSSFADGGTGGGKNFVQGVTFNAGGTTITTTGAAAPGNTGNTGGGGLHTVLSPALVLNKIIRY